MTASKVTKDQVVVFRDGDQEEWRVVFNDRVCTPMWRQRGPADMYLSLLKAGTRQPEYHDD